MQVTEVRVFPVDEDKLKAYVTITLDHCFVIRDLKIIHGTTGFFVSMPSKKRKDGTYKDIAHPINNETRRMIEEKIIAEYQKVLAEGGSAKALDNDVSRYFARPDELLRGGSGMGGRQAVRPRPLEPVSKVRILPAQPVSIAENWSR